jgi:hypothetical protein
VSTDHEAPHYEVFSISLLPSPPQAQTFSSTPYSQTPSAYVAPSMSATKFHTHPNLTISTIASASFISNTKTYTTPVWSSFAGFVCCSCCWDHPGFRSYNVTCYCAFLM